MSVVKINAIAVPEGAGAELDHFTPGVNWSVRRQLIAVSMNRVPDVQRLRHAEPLTKPHVHHADFAFELAEIGG